MPRIPIPRRGSARAGQPGPSAQGLIGAEGAGPEAIARGIGALGASLGQLGVGIARDELNQAEFDQSLTQQANLQEQRRIANQARLDRNSESDRRQDVADKDRILSRERAAEREAEVTEARVLAERQRTARARQSAYAAKAKLDFEALRAQVFGRIPDLSDEELGDPGALTDELFDQARAAIPKGLPPEDQEVAENDIALDVIDASTDLTALLEQERDDRARAAFDNTVSGIVQRTKPGRLRRDIAEINRIHSRDNAAGFIPDDVEREKARRDAVDSALLSGLSRGLQESDTRIETARNIVDGQFKGIIQESNRYNTLLSEARAALQRQEESIVEGLDQFDLTVGVLESADPKQVPGLLVEHIGDLDRRERLLLSARSAANPVLTESRYASMASRLFRSRIVINQQIQKYGIGMDIAFGERLSGGKSHAPTVAGVKTMTESYLIPYLRGSDTPENKQRILEQTIENVTYMDDSLGRFLTDILQTGTAQQKVLVAASLTRLYRKNEGFVAAPLTGDEGETQTQRAVTRAIPERELIRAQNIFDLVQNGWADDQAVAAADAIPQEDDLRETLKKGSVPNKEIKAAVDVLYGSELGVSDPRLRDRIVADHALNYVAALANGAKQGLALRIAKNKTAQEWRPNHRGEIQQYPLNLEYVSKDGEQYGMDQARDLIARALTERAKRLNPRNPEVRPEDVDLNQYDFDPVDDPTKPGEHIYTISQRRTGPDGEDLTLPGPMFTTDGSGNAQLLQLRPDYESSDAKLRDDASRESALRERADWIEAHREIRRVVNEVFIPNLPDGSEVVVDTQSLLRRPSKVSSREFLVQMLQESSSVEEVNARLEQLATWIPPGSTFESVQRQAREILSKENPTEWEIQRAEALAEFLAPYEQSLREEAAREERKNLIEQEQEERRQRTGILRPSDLSPSQIEDLLNEVDNRQVPQIGPKAPVRRIDRRKLMHPEPFTDELWRKAEGFRDFMDAVRARLKGPRRGPVLSEQTRRRFIESTKFLDAPIEPFKPAVQRLLEGVGTPRGPLLSEQQRRAFVEATRNPELPESLKRLLEGIGTPRGPLLSEQQRRSFVEATRNPEGLRELLEQIEEGQQVSRPRPESPDLVPSGIPALTKEQRRVLQEFLDNPPWAEGN